MSHDREGSRGLPPSLSSFLERVLRILADIRIQPAPLEQNVCDAVCEAFGKEGIPFGKEVTVAKGSRVDFLLEGGLVIEVKKGKPTCRVVEDQVKRYCEADTVSAVILVSERGLIAPPTKEHNGKPIRYVALSTNWGV